MDSDRIAFVCVGNAGRSGMAAAFVERERAERAVMQAGAVDAIDR